MKKLNFLVNLARSGHPRIDKEGKSQVNVRIKHPFFSRRLLLLPLLLVWLVKPTATFAQDDTFDLAITKIESDPADLRVGRETSFMVTYKNEGKTAVPADIENLELLLYAGTVEGNMEIGSCRQAISQEVAGLEPDEERSYDFKADCLIIFRSEEQHRLQAAFIPAETPLEELLAESYPTLTLGSGEDGVADGSSENNGVVQLVTIRPFETNLPDGLGRLFAGLGMFFAVMAIMAVGTEVVMDAVKVFFGLKSKITALEALERMEKLIPGQLATLGVNAASQQQFETLTRNMRRTIQPVSELPEVLERLKDGDFASVLEYLDKLGVEARIIQTLRTQLKSIHAIAEGAKSGNFDAAKPYLHELGIKTDVMPQASDLFNQLQSKMILGIGTVKKGMNTMVRTNPLNLTSDQIALITNISTQLDGIQSALQGLTPTDVTQVEDLYKNYEKLSSQWAALQVFLFQEVQTWSADKMTQWLTEQRADLLVLGREQVLSNFNNKLVPQLEPINQFWKSLNISQYDLIEDANLRLEWALTMLQSQAITETDKYIESLTNLLHGVEARRHEIQSPLRKLWRRLRDARPLAGFLFLGVILFSIITPLTYVIRMAFFADRMLSPHFALVGFSWTVTIIVSTASLGACIHNEGKKICFALVGTIPSIILHVVITLGWWWPGVICVCIGIGLNAIVGIIILICSYRSVNSDKPTILDLIEIFWNWLRGQKELAPQDFSQPPDTIKKVNASLERKKIEKLKLENAAQVVLISTNQQQDEDKSRLRWLRWLSLAVGLGLAYLLQIDAAELLETAVPGIANTINLNLYTTADRSLTVGILLTGFAAAAGSKFWHDRLGQLQAARKGAETAVELVNQAKQVAASVEQKQNT
ncbi:MAG: hypothetical protein KDE56_02965 [Anaerolineales bacterium]|nr:hypothetical protein [Anaerolineales bacterium]